MTDLLRALGSKECCSSEFPGFSLCLVYPRLCAGQAGSPETPTGADQEKPALSSQSTQKEQPSNTEIF